MNRYPYNYAKCIIILSSNNICVIVQRDAEIKKLIQTKNLGRKEYKKEVPVVS